MKITQEEELRLEAVPVVHGPNWPWGEKCPACGRPHVLDYTDGTRLCHKCDELVARGSSLVGGG